MIDPVRPAGVDDGEIVGALGDVGEPIGDPETASTVLTPLTLAPEDRGVEFSHGSDDLPKARWNWFSRELIEERFAIEGI